MAEDLLDILSEEDVTAIAKTIVSRSVKFAEKFPFLVIDDCIQVSWRELIRYQNYFTPGKSKITTWVYKLVTDTLTSYAQREYNKTQKWDNIENHDIEDLGIECPRQSYIYIDFINTLKDVLSPLGFKLLLELDGNPKICFSDLSKKLQLDERDLIYLREELRLTTLHILEE